MEKSTMEDIKKVLDIIYNMCHYSRRYKRACVNIGYDENNNIISFLFRSNYSCLYNYALFKLELNEIPHKVSRIKSFRSRDYYFVELLHNK